MINVDNMIKIKEYENFVLYKHKNTGVRECFMKSDLFSIKNKRKKYTNKIERS